jgi:hypothetical protein
MLLSIISYHTLMRCCLLALTRSLIHSLNQSVPTMAMDTLWPTLYHLHLKGNLPCGGDNDGVTCAPDWHWITVTMTNEIDMFRSSDIAHLCPIPVKVSYSLCH